MADKPVTQQIKDQPIVEELTTSYINYAMSVIVARALPDVRDGLKPVQRRILYAMNEMGLQPGSKYIKVAKIVGETLGKYHPHGDTAVTDALVRMAQDWNMRYPLIDGQGNFGSIDGDSHAAMRYIEARLAKYSVALLTDLKKNTVDYIPNFDETETEPAVLPALLPGLLLNGAEGIAVGMATKIPPHNLGEIVDALIASLEKGESKHETDRTIQVDYETAIRKQEDLGSLPVNRFPKFTSSVEISEILNYIKGPDFPTGAEAYDMAEIAKVYETGNGRILMRGVSRIEELKGGKFQIVITELPYQVNKQRLIEKIAELVKDSKIKGISGIKDLSSDRGGISVVIELKRDAKPKTVQNQLYKFTELQKAFNANIVALVEGEPQILNVKQILVYFLGHRQEVVVRRNEFNLAKLREREHILEGLMIALDHLDEVIETIRNSKDADVAKTALIKKFKLSDIQAQAILDMQLRRLAALERKKTEDEYKQVVSDIKAILAVISNPKKILEIISQELRELKEKYGDERRTRIHKGKAGEISEEDLIAKEEVIVTVSEQGYVKRFKNEAYQAQARGGVGKKAMTTKEDDAVRHVFSCSTHDEVLVFTNKGRVFALRVYEIPEYNTRTAKGVPIINLINIEQGELITSILTRSSEGHILEETKKERKGKSYKFLFMATKQGVVKKTQIDEFINIRTNGLIAIKLNENDELIWIKPTTGGDTIMLVSEKGKGIRFHETDVRETGRATMGVRGIRLQPSDQVIAMDILKSDEDFLLTMSRQGYGKVTKLKQFPVQKRGGAGVIAARTNEKTGILAAARILDGQPEEELLIMSTHGQAVRVPTKELPERNRPTAGVRMMRLKPEDLIAAIATV